jgi:hypothetical protein
MDKLTGATMKSVTGIGLSIAALSGNSKVGQVMGKVMAALHLATLVRSLFEKVKMGKDTIADTAKAGLSVTNSTAVTALTAAVVANTLAKAIPGKTGIIPKGYARGGVASGPNSGYPAVLHGNEAVVPLPDGRSIPIALKGGGAMNGGGTNNVSVAVNIDNQGQASSDTDSDGQQASILGEKIAQAVQDELINQKRNGGILSPFGAV